MGKSAHFGYIPGELSFAANSRELERTCQQFADTHTPANSAERSPECAERSPEFGGVRSGSPEFARTPPRTGERFARKFVRGKKSRPPLMSVTFAANVVRPWRTAVHQKAYFRWSERSFAANCCSPAANSCSRVAFSLAV